MSELERRDAVRRMACFPGLAEHGDAKVTAMIADLSESGALLLLRYPDWRVGDEVRLELHVSLDDGPPRPANGRVVRVEPLPDQRTSLWTHQVAVEFIEKIALSPAEVESLEKRQEPYGKRRAT